MRFNCAQRHSWLQGGSLINVILYSRGQSGCCGKHAMTCSRCVYLAAQHPLSPERTLIDFHTVLMLEPLLLAGTIGALQLLLHGKSLA